MTSLRYDTWYGMYQVVQVRMHETTPGHGYNRTLARGPYDLLHCQVHFYGTWYYISVEHLSCPAIGYVVNVALGSRQLVPGMAGFTFTVDCVAQHSMWYLNF